MQDEKIRLSEGERKAQRRRSLGIAAVLVSLIVIFYVVTLLKLGS